MRFTDYYRVLGVPPDAKPEVIKTAYRKLARKYHPDVCKEPGTVKRFTDIGEAHDVLEDPVRRTAYDKVRAGGWTDGQEMHAPPPMADDQDGQDDSGDFSDFFTSMFGRQAAGGRSHGSFRGVHRERGADMHYTLAVTLEESYAGSERQLSLQGTNGETRKLSVRIPKGVIQGTRIRLRGQGYPGSSAELHGDLYLDVDLIEHPVFHCDGGDVLLDVPIHPWEAVLGAAVDVPTLGGTVTATILPGAQQGQRLRLKGRGLPQDVPGDQYLVLQVVVPPAASETVKEAYRALATASAGESSPRRWSIHGR